MKKRLLSFIVAIALMVTIIPLSEITAFAAENEETLSANADSAINVKLMSESCVTEGDLVSTLPNGITYDEATATFTLNGYNGTFENGKSFFDISSGNVNIEIKGENTIKFVNGKYGTSFVNSNASKSGNLTIKGDGVLNLNFSGCSATWAIKGSRVTKIQDCTININSKNPDGYFYGYSADGGNNYSKSTEYAGLEILSANINIYSSMTEYAGNSGIDVHDSDLAIDDSNINIQLYGGMVCGLCAGLNDLDSVYYGGKISIDSDSDIVVEASDPEHQPCLMSYFTGNLSERNISVGTSSASCKKVKTSDFECIDSCYYCKGSYLEISSHEWTSSITPATTSKAGSVTKTCSHCNKTITTKIPKIISIKPGESLTRTWTGYDNGFFVIIENADGEFLSFNTKKSSDFKSVGQHKFTVTSASELYSFSKSFTLTIVPANTTVSGVTAGKNCMTVKMKSKVSATGGGYYQIAYKQKGASKWTYATTTSASQKIQSLKKNKQYYVKVRACKKVSGKVYSGSWTKTVLSAKVK